MTHDGYLFFKHFPMQFHPTVFSNNKKHGSEIIGSISCPNKPCNKLKKGDLHGRLQLII